MRPRRAIVRPPSRAFPSCISSHPLRDTIDVDKAVRQHEAYCNALKELGIELLVMNQEEEYPDSCFVEDTAVVHNGKALIAKMARPSRQGEENTVEALLKQYMRVRRVTKPGTLEGGDVIHLPNKLMTGVSQRTNIDGVFQMRDWLEVEVSAIRDPNIVHLKSHVTFLSKKNMICRNAYRDHPALEKYNLVILEDEDNYAANTLTIGETVLMPAGFGRAATLVREAGYEVMPIEVSEFEKCEGALTCLSILF